MTKKLYGALVPLLAVAAFAGMPAAAKAAPHWYKEGTRLPFTSAQTGTVMYGQTSMTMSNGIGMACKVLAAGNVWNSILASDGKGNVEVFDNLQCLSSECPQISIEYNGLSWQTGLTEIVGGTIRDSIPVIMYMNCSGTALDWTGTLEPKVVNGTSKTAPSHLEFGASSGTLTASDGETATWNGQIKIEGEEQELIAAKNP